MNRTIQAFAVLLVSLAGGMLAATWTSTLPLSRHAAQATTRTAAPRGMHCSCNPESLIRFEEGCARDKTTGEFYGCGLGLGNNGGGGKSVITHSANAVVGAIIENAEAVGEVMDGLRIQEWFAQGKELAVLLDSIKNQFPSQELPDDRRTEQDYAAAELAAAGYDPDKNDSANYLEPIRRLPSLFSAESVSEFSKLIVSNLGGLSRTCDRQTRLWLVEAGLHRHWDEAEAMQLEQQLAGMRLMADEESLGRWFENFPRSVTEPSRELTPDVPGGDFSDESRRTLLATAKLLDTLASLLHQTAENLARHAEQDVAELHKLKSGIEERR